MRKIKMTEVQITLLEAFELFRQKHISDNCSKDTIRSYNEFFSKLCTFAKQSDAVSVITKQFTEDFSTFLHGQPLADKSVSSYMVRYRAFAYFLMEREIIEQFRIKIPRSAKPIKETYTEEELKWLLEKPKVKQCSFSEYRNWVLVNYFLSTGQRLSSVTNIRIKDLDLQNGVVTLKHTKNKTDTVLPLSTSICTILGEYLRYRKGEDDDFLFCTESGEQLQRYGIRSAIMRYNKGRGVKKSSIHMFRHTYAKMYLMNGGDVFRLQKLMCHSDLNVTKEYLDFNVQELKQNYEQLNPLDHFRNPTKKISLSNR